MEWESSQRISSVLKISFLFYLNHFCIYIFELTNCLLYGLFYSQCFLMHYSSHSLGSSALETLSVSFLEFTLVKCSFCSLTLCLSSLSWTAFLSFLWLTEFLHYCYFEFSSSQIVVFHDFKFDFWRTVSFLFWYRVSMDFHRAGFVFPVLHLKQQAPFLFR